MPGFANGVMFADNVDFSGGHPVVGEVTTDGQLLIGATAAPHIRAGSLTSTGGTITITPGAGTINLEAAGGHVGETITGDSGGALSPTAGNWNIFGGTGVSTSGSGSTLTINAFGGGLTWQAVSTSQTMLINNGYIAISPGAGLQFALPSTSKVGDVIALTLDGATSWTITQGIGQQVRLGQSQTTSGATGSLVSTAQGNTIILVCSVANTRWNAFAPQGNITIN